MVKSELDLPAIASGKIKEDEANLEEIRQNIHGWFEALIPQTIIARGEPFTCVVVVSSKWKKWGREEERRRGGGGTPELEADLPFLPSLSFSLRWSLGKAEDWNWFVRFKSLLLTLLYADPSLLVPTSSQE